MKILPAYPQYASGHCDFTDKSADLGPDDRVVCLDAEVEMQSIGVLCLSSRTIEKIVVMLGWKLQSDDDRTALITARKDLAVALERLDAYSELADALERVFSPPPVLEVVQ